MMDTPLHQLKGPDTQPDLLDKLLSDFTEAYSCPLLIPAAPFLLPPRRRTHLSPFNDQPCRAVNRALLSAVFAILRFGAFSTSDLARF